jgi:hypothetical protein
MKIIVTVKGLAAVSFSLVPAMGTGQPVSAKEITVYITNGHVTPATVLAQAQQTATRIFAGAAVPLQWKLGDAKRKQTAPGADTTRCAIEVRVDLLSRVPEDVSPWAFARSFPLQTKELRIDVLVDRFGRILRRQPLLAGPLLGHVLAHEIAHVLQGVSRHSEAGILRARWNGRDYRQMQRQLMEFDRAEVKHIHLGIEWRLRSCSTLVSTAR